MKREKATASFFVSRLRRRALCFAACTALLGGAFRCTNELPLSDLINNTITLKFLGTYESNDPYGFSSTLPLDDVFSATGITNSINSLTNATNMWAYARDASDGLANNASRVQYYIDLAEVRIAQGQGISSSQAITDYWSQFAITRQLMCSTTASGDGRSYSNCADSNGVQRLSDFFNGGFIYPASDIATGIYNNVGIYFRRFVTSPSALFDLNGNYIDSSFNVLTSRTQAEQVATTTFDNRTVFGTDVETLLQNPYGQTPASPLMFPLQRFDLNVNITNGNEPYVMEVRVFMKNLMMVHLTQNAAGSNTGYVYVAPADWNTDHAFTDTANAGKMGGSLLMAVRTYQPRYVGAIQMSAASASGYYAVMPAGSAFGTQNGGVQWNNTPTAVSTAVLPWAATAATNTTITNLPPGSYDVYHTCDLYQCTNSSTPGYCDVFSGSKASPTPDGYPETADYCGTVNVTATTTTPLTLPAACTGSGACP